MHKEKYVFSQLVSFLDRNKFNYIVRKYDGDKYVKHFTCWNQLLMLSIRQLLTCAFQSFGGLNSARRKEVSKCIHYMM